MGMFLKLPVLFPNRNQKISHHVIQAKRYSSKTPRGKDVEQVYREKKLRTIYQCRSRIYYAVKYL